MDRRARSCFAARAILAFVCTLPVAIGLAGCMREAAVGELEVIVDPKLSPEGALHVGDNPGKPFSGKRSVVQVRREQDGTLVVEVRGFKNEFCFVSRLWLRETPTGPRASATACSQESGRSKWPFETMRGSAHVSSGHWSDFSNSPFVVETEMTGMCSGSDVTWKRKVAFTEADLRSVR